MLKGLAKFSSLSRKQETCRVCRYHQRRMAFLVDIWIRISNNVCPLVVMFVSRNPNGHIHSLTVWPLYLVTCELLISCCSEDIWFWFFQWMRARWTSDPCYAFYGVDGSDCSFLVYLSEVEWFCPPQVWRNQSATPTSKPPPKRQVTGQRVDKE